MKFSIIIPVYNEEKTVKNIIDDLLKLNFEKEIIIINDGSNDNTLSILQKNFSDIKKLKIFPFEQNQGKGASIKKGIELSNNENLIIFDADGEIPIKELQKLAEAYEQNRCLVLYGSRFLNPNNKFYFFQKIGNKLINFLFNILNNTNLTDIETGLKIFRKDILSHSELLSTRFEIEIELTYKFLKKNIKILEVPVTYFYRNHKEGKKLNFLDGITAIISLLKFRI